MYLMHQRTKKLDPLARHKQARDIGRLDFSAPGPMSYPRTNREQLWEAYRSAALGTNQPGTYVPFLSYEAHPSHGAAKADPGDRNIIFKHLEEALPPDFALPLDTIEARYGDRDDVMLQVHIGGSTPKWDLYRTKRERLLEISSGFGNAEWLLRKALKLGYRPAICGCSDLHSGLLGGPRSVETFRGRMQKTMNQRDSAYGTGPLTAVYAREKTRASLWQSISDRQTYATTGARIFLRARFNGMPVGSTLARTAPLRLQLTCCGTATIDRVDILCGDYTVRSWAPDRLDFEADVTFQPHELPGDWLYARIRQTDDNYAWTTPVWLEAEYPRWDDDACLSDEHDANEAALYLEQVMRYLETEENPELFHDLTPVRIIEQTNARCALFYLRFGAGQKMSLRWYFEFPIPKIRFDWGWNDYGTKDDTADECLT